MNNDLKIIDDASNHTVTFQLLSDKTRITSKLTEKSNNLKSKGKTDSEAYKLTIDPFKI